MLRAAAFMIALAATLIGAAHSPAPSPTASPTGALSPSPRPLVLTLVPSEEPVALHHVQPGQEFVWLVEVLDPSGSADPVPIRFEGECWEALQPPTSVLPGEVLEVGVRILPVDACSAAPDTSGQPTARFRAVVERAGIEVTEERTMPIWDEPVVPLADALVLRDRFVAWLAAAHPELGITPGTTWRRVPAGAEILVVEHELFFSDAWELGLSWHVMIAPDDWAEIYLRHRGDELAPSFAARITSVSGGVAPVEVPPPAVVRR
jgi:hypothetical protein